MPISKTLHLSLAKADIHIPVDTEPDMLGRVIEAAERQRTETKRRVRLGLPIGNVRLSEWERVTLKRGPNKGKTAWKKGNRYFHGEKPPEGRGGKQEAGTKGKSAPKPKANKMTPQAMVEKHKAIMAKGSTSHDDMQGFVDDLLTMTVKDINEVKKSLGLKASGKKAELAKKIGQKAFELVGKGKAAEVGKTKPEQAKSKASEFNAVNQYVRKLQNKAKGGPVKIPDVLDEMEKQGMNREEARDQLWEWKREGKFRLTRAVDDHLEPRREDGIQTNRGNLFYISPTEKSEWREPIDGIDKRVSKDNLRKTEKDFVSKLTKEPEPKPANKPTDKNIDTMSPGELYKYAKELGIKPGRSKPQNMKLIKDHLGKNEGQ